MTHRLTNPIAGPPRAGRPSFTLFVRRWLALATVGLMSLGAVGCGASGDSADDCVRGEFYDQANEQCRSCPAAVEPECRPGCGFHITEDDRGCPVAECLDQCRCESGQFFSEDTFSCQMCQEATDPPVICDDAN